jgi:DNA-binding PadR family transcriptional regulator
LQDLSSLGRYAESAMLIMVSLAGGPKHGYAGMEDVLDLTGVRIGPGTLYAALARMERQGLIESLPAEARRRPYQLTAEGERLLRAQLETLNALTAVGLTRLAPA